MARNGRETLSFTYNLRNRPVAVTRSGTSPTQTSRYAFNAQEQMVQRSTNAPGGPAGGVQRGRVPNRRQGGRHRLDGFGMHRGGRGVVEIDRPGIAHGPFRIPARSGLPGRPRRRLGADRQFREVIAVSAAAHSHLAARREVPPAGPGQLQGLHLDAHDRVPGTGDPLE